MLEEYFDLLERFARILQITRDGGDAQTDAVGVGIVLATLLDSAKDGLALVIRRLSGGGIMSQPTEAIHILDELCAHVAFLCKVGIQADQDDAHVALAIIRERIGAARGACWPHLYEPGGELVDTE